MSINYEHILTIALVGSVGLNIWSMYKAKIKRPFSATDARKVMRSKNYVMDATKQKSLQPSNQKINLVNLDGPKLTPDPVVERIKLTPSGTKKRTATAPAGYVDPSKETKMPDHFVHDFFGSKLSVGDYEVGGLSRKKHRLEITKDGLFIDNTQYPINGGDLEKIKQLIQLARK